MTDVKQACVLRVCISGMKQKILVVDDEEAVLFGMREYFSTLGYEVDCARKVEEAQAMLSCVTYAAVIADLRLSGTHGAEGLDVIGFVRETQPRTRVILLTAYGSPEVTAEAKRRGVDAVLQKPKPLKEVADVLCDLIGDPA